MASEAKGPSPAPVKASRPKWGILLTALVLLNMLGMAGIGAYVALRPQTAAAESEADEEHPSEAEHLGPLVEFESMVVNLADGEGGRYLKVTFQMELASEEDVEHVEAHLVQVRDAVLGHLSSLTVEDVHGAGRIAALREHLLVMINELLGGERVRHLYFTEYLVQ